MPTIAAIGEALFDIYPDQTRRLGGATLNFAVHAHQLQSRIGGRSIPVTRTGSDPLGHQLLTALQQFNTDTSYTQIDRIRPTGQVLVTFDSHGSPNYDILREVAWDFIELTEPLRTLAQQADAVCFGTLAQRSPTSRATIQAFVEAAPPHALKLCDINLRQQYFTSTLIIRSLELANAAKLNDAELLTVCQMLDVSSSPADSAHALLDRFQLNYLILTRGELGTTIHTPQSVFIGERVSYPPAADADPVGAGDACAAAVAVGLLLGHSPALVANFANHIGAYVAAQPGGTPRLPPELLINQDSTFPV